MRDVERAPRDMPEEEAQRDIESESATQPTAVPNAKEAYDRRREEKRASRAVPDDRGRSSGVNRPVRLLLWLTLIAALGYGLYVLVGKNTPQSEDVSRAIPVEANAEHIAVGAVHEPYNSNPPTSGPHYETPAHPGFREEAITDEYLVHSLEHGLVWIAYNPRIAESAREVLRELAGVWVVVTAREANETDIALAAWGRLDAFNLEGGELNDTTERRIRDFIARYRGRGPERIPAGQHGGI